MKISTKGEYGLRAMLYLAMRDSGEAVTSHEIATHQAIPEPYLRQILAVLSKAGLIESTRGPNGGHLLARPADAIPLRHIVTALEGTTTSVDQILSLPCEIEIGSSHCAIREVLLEIKAAVERILSETTLGALARRQQELLDRGIEVPWDVDPPAGHPLPVVDETT